MVLLAVFFAFGVDFFCNSLGGKDDIIFTVVGVSNYTEMISNKILSYKNKIMFV